MVSEAHGVEQPASPAPTGQPVSVSTTGQPGDGSPSAQDQGTELTEGADAPDRLPHTRLSATWTGLVLGLVVLVVLIIFIAQNTQRSTVHFFGLDGSAPTAVVLLIASVAGALVVVGVAMARLLQLRSSARRSVPGRPARARSAPSRR